MKKVISLIITIMLAVALFGCSNANNNDNTQTSATNAETTAKQLSLDDYEVLPGANVISVTGASNGIGLETICPICGNTGGGVVSFVEVEDRIGQNSFTYSESIMCENWANHPNVFETDYPFTVTFQLKN